MTFVPGSPDAGPGCKRLTIFAGSRDHAGHHSLVVELLHQAKRSRLAGATVIEAVGGHGRSGRVHRAHLFSDDASVSVVIVDRADRIEAFLEAHDALVRGAVVVVDEVHAFRA